MVRDTCSINKLVDLHIHSYFSDGTMSPDCHGTFKNTLIDQMNTTIEQVDIRMLLTEE